MQTEPNPSELLIEELRKHLSRSARRGRWLFSIVLLAVSVALVTIYTGTYKISNEVVLLKEQLRNQHSELQQQESQIELQESQVATLNSAVAELDPIQEDVELIVKYIQGIEQKQETLEVELLQRKLQVTIVDLAQEGARAELQPLTEALQSLTERMQSLEERAQSLEEKVPALESLMASQASSITGLVSSQEQSAEELEELRRALRDLGSRLESLGGQITALSEASRSHSHLALNQEISTIGQRLVELAEFDAEVQQLTEQNRARIRGIDTNLGKVEARLYRSSIHREGEEDVEIDDSELKITLGRVRKVDGGERGEEFYFTDFLLRDSGSGRQVFPRVGDPSTSSSGQVFLDRAYPFTHQGCDYVLETRRLVKLPGFKDFVEVTLDRQCPEPTPAIEPR